MLSVLVLTALVLGAASSPISTAFAVSGRGLALRPRSDRIRVVSRKTAQPRTGVWESPRAGCLKKMVKMTTATTLAVGAFVGFNAWYLSQALYEPAPTPDPYNAIKNVEVLRVTDGTPVKLTSLWREDERAVLMLFRSFG